MASPSDTPRNLVLDLLKGALGRASRSVWLLAGLLLIGGGMTVFVLFAFCRVYVPPGMCLVRIAKNGAPLPADQTVAEPGQKGIQRETWGPGRYFLNPINWDWKLEPLVEISPGKIDSWTWVHKVDRLPTNRGPDGNVINGDLPEIGILIRKTGPTPPNDTPQPLAKGYRGPVQEVLTPGVYRINPYEFEVKKQKATVIPAGFVGVVTNQIGVTAPLVDVPDVAMVGSTTQPESPPVTTKVRRLAKAGERGTLPDVLVPGVYYVNPYMVRVKITEVGFNEFTQAVNRKTRETIRFPSKSGYDIELGVIVVWGLHPRHAAEVINEFGAMDEVLEKVIKPQLRSICRNEGSKYEARDFIQGEKREEFQHLLTTTLKEVCRKKHIELLLALISNVEVSSKEGNAASDESDLRTEIQESFLAVERQLTNVKLQETTKKQAELETQKKKVDVARETIQAQTRKRVAQTMADGQRKAAEIAAQARLTVAEIDQKIAAIDAQKVELLGKARADVAKLKQQAEADGKKLLVEALGSGDAYNLYTFARNFQPESIRMIFAGPGTFWTDLKKLDEVSAATILKQATTDQPAKE